MELSEVAPPGWGHTKAEKEKTKPDKPKSKIGGSAAAFKRALDDGRFKGLPGDKTYKDKKESMFKLMWSMKKKGDKPHYKPGTDEKYKKYQEEETSCDSPYEKLKKKIGSKKMHKEPVVVERYDNTERGAKESHKFHTFYKKAKEAKAKQQADSTRSDSRRHGIKFSDAKGSGRIRAGKKYYD